MSGKYIRMTIWAFDEGLNLDMLPELLRLDYSTKISYLEEFDLEDDDKTLKHEWKEYYTGQGFNKHEVTISNTNIEFLPAVAVYEVPDSERDAVYDDGGYIVPRHRRVHSYVQNVFFFMNSGRTYAVVVGPQSSDSRLRSSLMGARRPRNPLYKAWGKVNSTDVKNYILPSELLYWLIAKQNTVLETAFISFRVRDIRYLAQSTDRNDAKHMSEGANLLDEAIPQTGLGVNSTIGQLGTTFIIPGLANLRLVIRSSGECIIDTEVSAIIGDSGDFEPIDDNAEKVAMLLYMLILPGLRSAYNADVNNGAWTTLHEANARKQWALGAINELCFANNIELEEIMGLEKFQKSDV